MRLKLVTALSVAIAPHFRRQMMSLAPRVAIVGCGISGILSAQELTSAGLNPVLFEGSCPGGLWASGRGRMWKSLKTNLSKYTCSVSNQPWNDVPAFPSHLQVEEYLDKLRTGLSVNNNAQVRRIERVGDSYNLAWTDSNGMERTELFDKVIVATGFFTKPNPLSADLSSFQGSTIFSQNYAEPSGLSDRNVLVVGGSFSGCEIAAEIASVAASVHHVVPRHAYVIPTFLPESNADPAPAFLPIDCAFYAQSDQRLQQIDTAMRDNSWIENIVKSAEEDAHSHSYFKALVGPTNDLLGRSSERKVRVAISDNYRRMVKLGKIKIVNGRLKTLQNHQYSVQQTGDTLCDVPFAADVCLVANGFGPDLSIFSDELLTILRGAAATPESNSSPDDFLPLLLDREIMHPDLPGLYFVGMYRGPYFGVVELQARLVSGYITGRVPLPSYERSQEGLTRAAQIRNQNPRPQFPHPDYPGMLFDYARELQVVPPADFRQRHRIVTPAYFTGSDSAMAPMQHDLQQWREQGRGIGRAVLQALEGDHWQFRRVIEDARNQSSAVVEGVVTFKPIAPNFTHVLYEERGQLKLPNGGTFDVAQHYVYHYNEETDALDIFFSTVGKPEVIDRPFVSLKFNRTSSGWEATADHLCSCDNYHAVYRFAFAGLSIPHFHIAFDVEGPSKQYRAVTEFTLQLPSSS